MEKVSYEGITEDFATLRQLSPAYAGREGELTAVLQYVYQSVVLGEQGRGDLAKGIFRIAAEEMRHLEALATVIAKLGSLPVFTACPPYPVGYFSASCVNYTKNARQMISADICAEENAIAFYEAFLCRIKNPPVAAIVSAVLDDERSHLAALNGMLSEL